MSTKFVLAVGIFAVASVFLGLGCIDQDVWLQVVLWNAGIYGGGNVSATLAHTRKKRA